MLKTGLLAILFMALGTVSGKAGVREKNLIQKQNELLRSFAPLNSKAKSMALLEKGKLRVLLFWASWCPYCKQAVANLMPSYTQWLAKGAEFYIISVDDTQSAAEAFLGRSPVRMPIWWGGSNAKNMFQISILPTILLLGEDNRILSEYAGYGEERYTYMKKRMGSLLRIQQEEE